MFRSVWWVGNALLILALTGTVWEYSMRQYLRGFSDAMVPESTAPQQKVEAILAGIPSGPARLEARSLAAPLPRDPQYCFPGWGGLADNRSRIPRFHLRTNLSRATAALFSTPEIN